MVERAYPEDLKKSYAKQIQEFQERVNELKEEIKNYVRLSEQSGSNDWVIYLLAFAVALLIFALILYLYYQRR